MSTPFQVQVTVRNYELDTQGPLNNAAYIQYGDHARWEMLRAAGVTVDRMLTAGLGPVTLETTIRFHRELRAGDAVTISCVFIWEAGKTFRIEQELRRADDSVAAEIRSVGGLLDLVQRRLLPDPRSRWLALATNPSALGGHDLRGKPQAELPLESWRVPYAAAGWSTAMFS